MTEEVKKVYLIAWALMSEWWHVDNGCTEEEIVDTIYKHMNPESGPDFCGTKEQIKQRLFGGFDCGNGTGYHVFHSAGHYTYTGINGPLNSSERISIWQELLEKNVDNKPNKESFFMEDYPGDKPNGM